MTTPTAACEIIIPIWNQPVLTRRCLDSVRATTQDYRLILVDNGSEAPTRQLLDETAQADPHRVQIIRNAENLGFIKAVNQGLRASTAPSVCLLNNDTVTTPGWLKEMIRVTEQDPAIGLVNPSSNTLGYRPAQPTPDGILAYAETLAASRGQTREIAMAVGFCLLIKRAVVEAIGLLDERYGMGNFEDADFSLRAQAAGYRSVQAVGAYVYHEEKASFKHQAGWQTAFQANQRLFAQEWGRALRIVWEHHAPAPSLEPAWTQAVVRLLRRGHQFWISGAAHESDTASGTVTPEILGYTSVSPLTTGRRWRWACLWYVMKRRKKPVDLVICHDRSLARWLHRLRPWHRATILARPTPEELEAACHRLSHSP